MGACFDEKTVHFLSLGPGLAGHKDAAQKLFGIFSHFFRRMGQLDASRLSAAAGMDLGLHNHHRCADTLRCSHRILHGECGISFGHMNAIFLHNGLALILMYIHKHPPFGNERTASAVPEEGAKNGLPLFFDDSITFPIISPYVSAKKVKFHK